MNNKRKRLTLKNAIIFITLLLTLIILALGTIKLVQIFITYKIFISNY